MQTINIDSIKVDNHYLRLDTNVDKLMKSIETVGLIHPLVINENDELISGGRRYSALKEMGEVDIPIIRVSKNNLEQELISIDENLVRKDLNKIEIEKCLSRGREIYEELFPDAVKFSEEDLTTPAQNELQVEMPNEKRSFIDLTSEKTGLSKKVIKSAIEREEKSSEIVKKLRELGSLNATQANELIKLSKDEQETLAPVVEGKSAKEIKGLVKSINQKGFDTALEEYTNTPHLPKEYTGLQTLLGRTNKVMAKILIEEIHTQSDEIHSILEQINTLRISLDQFLVLHTSQGQVTNQVSDEDYNDVISEAITSLDRSSDSPTMEES